MQLPLAQLLCMRILLLRHVSPRLLCIYLLTYRTDSCVALQHGFSACLVTERECRVPALNGVVCGLEDLEEFRGWVDEEGGRCGWDGGGSWALGGSREGRFRKVRCYLGGLVLWRLE
ncbi:hypothetical protein EJ04DRAFT_267775 [Polyplosphaeria fusca]|uniref:Secreted protein n=1 Tax=Polyplosphaeria fusca TaxID=682080 RepID=A0A9P4QZ04_9PLEO|nr:hypothetical protein EJ04DRAFT_267775 [Polyplosphaeria fusca]